MALGTSPLLLFCFRLSFINLILSFLPPTSFMWVFSCVSLSHRLEFLRSCSVSVQLHWLPHFPIQPLATTLLNYTILLRHFHRQYSSLSKLHIGATGDYLLDSWTLRMGPTGCASMSVRNYHYSLHNNPEERSSQLLCGRSLKSPIHCHYHHHHMTHDWGYFNATCP